MATEKSHKEAVSLVLFSMIFFCECCSPFTHIMPLFISLIMRFHTVLVIQGVLAARIIHSSSSPTGVGVFFVEKKDIEYWLQRSKWYHSKESLSTATHFVSFWASPNAQIFASLDLWSLRLVEDCLQHSQSTSGHCGCLVMPFRVTSAPSSRPWSLRYAKCLCVSQLHSHFLVRSRTCDPCMLVANTF